MQIHSSKDALAAATTRKTDMNLSYAGALTPPEAYAVLRADARAVLVDVRTIPELAYVGRMPESVNIEWQIFPDMTINERFCEYLQNKVEREQPTLFLCRSGVRSHHAATAAAAAGWHNAYNILQGFEGDLDNNGQRNKLNGWRFHGLPWVQS